MGLRLGQGHPRGHRHWHRWSALCQVELLCEAEFLRACCLRVGVFPPNALRYPTLRSAALSERLDGLSERNEVRRIGRPTPGVTRDDPAVRGESCGCAHCTCRLLTRRHW